VTTPEQSAPSDERWTSRRAAGNVLATAGAQVLGKVLTLVWTVVAARELTRHDFGEFNFALSLALILSAISEWGFDPALVRMASRSQADRDRHYTEAFVAESLVGVLLFGAVIAAVLPTRDTGADRLAMALVFIAVFVDLWNDTARSVGAAAARQGRTSAALLVQRVVTAALVLPLLWLGTGIAGLAGGMLGGYVVGWFANVAAVRSFGSRLRLRSLSGPEFRSFVRQSLPIGVSSLILALVARIDVVLIELFKGSAAVASYAAAYRLFEAVLFVTFAVSSATFPMMSASGDDHERVRTVVRAAAAIMTVLLMPFTAVCLVDTTGVLALFGESYQELSAGALRWLAIAPIAYSLAYCTGTALIAVGRNRGLVISSAVALAVNVILNLAVVPRWAGTGAALVTTLSYMAEAAVGIMLLRPVTGPFRWLSAAPESLVAGVILGLGLWLVPAPAIVEIPVGLVGYVLCWVALAWWRNRGQLDFVLSLLGRARRT
jgi:O-antigen/teichoic acid export membrane protein